jgi:hypothetical protein
MIHSAHAFSLDMTCSVRRFALPCAGLTRLPRNSNRYFFAGLAKCHRDWLGGTIMRMKLSRKTEFPVTACCSPKISAVRSVGRAAARPARLSDAAGSGRFRGTIAASGFR